MKIIFSENAPQAIGPYSQAIQTGNLIFCSGQTPLNPQTMKVEGLSVKDQTMLVLSNLEIILRSVHLTLQDVVKVNVYLTSMEDFTEMNEVYKKKFAGHYPARTTVAVVGLPLNALVEIECIAETNEVA